ncbi:MAG: hypothetical protein UY35_C0003G0016 [Candidatus Saccharibacteria bacterium GW2011_GWC2_48_9]|nr:MAG: hypothetical protein UY35_C0003G0016 [Candidatus Saccharibacteria bacterium GW2011_GWC2_48_9]HCH34155.1 hypothetical protein [Candidatus Saccharibacteria bacterium]
MAKQRTVQKTIKNLQRIKTWQLLILLVLMAFVAATFLRLNNVGMTQRRDAVISADEQGKSETTRNRLLDLQHYVSAHMNTGQNDVYLASQYERDKAALVEQAATANQSGAVINQQVDAICKPQFSGYNQGYVDCFAREYAKYAPDSDPVSQVKMPDPDRYRFVFASPLWSPDFAGFSIFACVFIVLLILGRMITLVVLKLLLKSKYQDI